MPKANRQRIRVKCKRPNCRYSWIYTGKSQFYACCPRCHTPVKL